MRKFDLSLRSSRSSYFATFRHQLTILSKTDALDEEKWLNMLGTFVKDWFRYESHFVHGRDSLVDILKERGLLSESDAVGRVQQTYKHSVPRFFVPEHGTMFTLALVRFPPTATKEIQYLNAKGALTYTDIAGDPVLYGNLPPREISMKDVFRSGDS